MVDSLTTKVCGMCSMDIPSTARKCPYCQHLQNRLATFIYHPLFIVSLGMIMIMLIGGAMNVMFKGMMDPGEDFQKYSDQITVSDTRLQFSDGESGPSVSVVGRVHNASEVRWREVLLQIEFHDADGNLVEAGQKHGYPFYLPAHDDVGFLASFVRELPEATYASFTVRVIAAKDARARF